MEGEEELVRVCRWSGISGEGEQRHQGGFRVKEAVVVGSEKMLGLLPQCLP